MRPLIEARPLTRRFLFALLFAAVLIRPALAHAQAPADQLKKIEQQLEERRARQAELAKKGKEIARELDGLRGNLTEAASAVREREQELSEAERGLTTTASEERERSAALVHERETLSAMLMALTRVTRVPVESYVAWPEAPVDAARAALLMRTAVPALADRARHLSDELVQLAELRKQLDGKRRDAERAEKALKQQQASLGGLLERREALYKQTDADRKAEESRIASLSRDAKDLRDLMARIEAEQRAEAARRAAAERKARAKGKKPPRPTEDSDTGPVVASGALPVAGTVRIRYGQDDGLGGTARGITITTRPGATVTAPVAGKVRFAGPFRSYGRILILEHPGGYHSLIAGMARVDTSVGTSVGAGEPIGVMPTDGEKPDLYFEFRRNGQPINPQMATSVKGRSG